LRAAGFEAMAVGGIATFAWGTPRTTEDLDVAVLAADRDPEAVRACLQPLGASVHGPFMTEFGPRFVLPFKDGLPVDVFLAGDNDKESFSRTRRIRIAGVDLRVTSPEDLVLSKLRNAARFPEDRAKDVQDASAVLFHQWGRFDWVYARPRAATLGVAEMLQRVAREAQEARRRSGLPAEEPA
jgi:predicted nucleotidyltransferase